PEVTHFYLVPEAPLHGLAWGALPDARGHYLVESGPRVTVLEAERDLLARPAPGGHGLLAVGGVNFDRAAAALADTAASLAARLRSAPSSCREALEHLGSLPATREEARAVAAACGRLRIPQSGIAVLEGDGASEA